MLDADKAPSSMIAFCGTMMGFYVSRDRIERIMQALFNGIDAKFVPPADTWWLFITEHGKRRAYCGVGRPRVPERVVP